MEITKSLLIVPLYPFMSLIDRTTLASNSFRLCSGTPNFLQMAPAFASRRVAAYLNLAKLPIELGSMYYTGRGNSN